MYDFPDALLSKTNTQVTWMHNFPDSAEDISSQFQSLHNSQDIYNTDDTVDTKMYTTDTDTAKAGNDTKVRGTINDDTDEGSDFEIIPVDGVEEIEDQVQDSWSDLDE
uniref:Replication factor C small subunit n=1 Tax=Lygus hesperus TaxID=30085 RepID=A0A0A9YQB4_LYGHE